MLSRIFSILTGFSRSSRPGQPIRFSSRSRKRLNWSQFICQSGR